MILSPPTVHFCVANPRLRYGYRLLFVFRFGCGIDKVDGVGAVQHAVSYSLREVSYFVGCRGAPCIAFATGKKGADFTKLASGRVNCGAGKEMRVMVKGIG